jgi:hypothetical protein
MTTSNAAELRRVKKLKYIDPNNWRLRSTWPPICSPCAVREFFHRHLVLAGFLVCATLMGGCASQAVSTRPNDNQVPRALWQGSVTRTMVPDIEGTGSESVRMMLNNCDIVPRIIFETPAGRANRIQPLKVISYEGTHLFYFIDSEAGKPNGWVESQVWTLLEARQGEWTIAQSRSVLNREDSEQDPWRTFRQFSVGTLRQVPEGCRGS